MTPPLSAFHCQNSLEEFGAAEVAPALLLSLHQLPFDHHLRGDTGVVGAGLPQNVPAAHPFKATEDVLQSVIERMPHVQRTGHIGRRDHDREGLGVLPLGATGLEGAAFLPDAGHAAFNIGGLVVLLDHDGSFGGLERA